MTTNDQIITQTQNELSRRAWLGITNLTVVQRDKNTAWIDGTLFNKQINLTVALTATGRVQKNSIVIK